MLSGALNNFVVGTDIESIARFRELNRSKDKIFLHKIFTKKELKFCFSKKNFAERLAVRFAAKEAIFKALTAMGVKNIPFYAIEILNGEDKVPRATVNIEGGKELEIALSLSHCEDKALAFVMITKV